MSEMNESVLLRISTLVHGGILWAMNRGAPGTSPALPPGIVSACCSTRSSERPGQPPLSGYPPPKPRPFWVRDLLVQVALLCQNPNHSPSTPSLTSEVGKAQLASQPHAV